MRAYYNEIDPFAAQWLRNLIAGGHIAPGDVDETWDAAQNFADEICGWEGVAELLGRVVMLTMPMESGLTKRLSHCLGTVTIRDGRADMIAAVRRDAVKEPSHENR